MPSPSVDTSVVPRINTRIADLSPNYRCGIAAAVFRYQADGQYTVLIMKHVTGTVVRGKWIIPTGPVLDTDPTIGDVVRRIVFAKADLRIQGHYTIRHVATTWKFGNEVNLLLSFAINDIFADMVTVRPNKLSEDQWEDEERYGLYAIPWDTKDVIHEGFDFHRSAAI